MHRRDFLKVVGGSSLVAIAPSLIEGQLKADDGTMFQSYEKVQLLDAQGNPLLASKLTAEENYVFNYPHAGTSCLLIALPKATKKDIKLKSELDEEYIWKSGVGANSHIVAYSAICPHQLTHVNKEDAFISYIPTNGKTMACKKDSVIVCGSHLSAYEPSKGCSVIAGPAPQPLASIVLEHHDDDTLWAVAVLGPDKFHDFFKSFKPELKVQYGGKRKAKKLVYASTEVVKLSDFTKDIIQY